MSRSADTPHDCGDLDGADLESVIATSELRRRPTRPPDYASENRALVALVEARRRRQTTFCSTLVESP
jgi:hypothetical protein